MYSELYSLFSLLPEFKHPEDDHSQKAISEGVNVVFIPKEVDATLAITYKLIP